MTSSPDGQRALAVVDLIREGRFEELQRQFLPMLHGVISAPALRDAWQTKVARYGDLRTVGDPVVTPARQGMTVARVGLEFERVTVTVAISMIEQRLMNIAIEDAATPAPQTLAGGESARG